MILVPPEFDCRGGEGSEASGLIASIKYALATEAPATSSSGELRRI